MVEAATSQHIIDHQSLCVCYYITFMQNLHQNDPHRQKCYFLQKCLCSSAQSLSTTIFVSLGLVALLQMFFLAWTWWCLCTLALYNNDKPFFFSIIFQKNQANF